MINQTHCDEFAGRLADLLERDVDEATRSALEGHALECAECGSLLADLRKLRIDASNLPVLTPSRDLWDGIASRIDAPVIPLPTGDRRQIQIGRTWRRWGPVAAAAVLLMAVTSLSTYYLTIQSHRGGTVTTASAPTRGVADSTQRIVVDSSAAPRIVAALPVDSATGRTQSRTRTQRASSSPGVPAVRLASTKPSAQQVYASEIARLHAIVERRRSQLDPVTISVIERNLKVIDDAISQCKLALAKDPASRFLMESLNNALETKVELLRTATMLPTRSS